MNNLADLFSRTDREPIEKWCRAQTQQCYLGDNTALCRVLGKYLMYVDTRDQSLTPHLMMNGFWEMWVTAAIARYVKPGMICVDAGANVGYYSMLLADLVGEQGRVFAYEPQRDLVKLSERSAQVNGFHHLDTIGVALGAVTGSAGIHCSETDRGAGALFAKPGLNLLGGTRIAKLDDNTILQQAPVDFVKIDVQGYEMEALRGMRETIARSPGIAIAMEFTPGEHEDPQASLAEIEDMGFTVRTIGTDGNVRPLTPDQAVRPDTGDHRMLWLTRI